MRRRDVTASATVLVVAAAALLLLDRGTGSDDSGEPRFLRFVGTSLTDAVEPFIRVDDGNGLRVPIAGVTLRRIGRTRSEFCVVARTEQARPPYSVRVVNSPAKRFGKTFPTAVVVRNPNGNVLAQTGAVRRSLCKT